MSNEDTANINTIRLDVGGKLFKVPKDLIMKDLDDGTGNDESENRTMLSRLVSDTWLQNPESEVYIGRDGDRFTYVLDYLRHGEVVLPNIISIDSFMKDLDYYGIPFQQTNIRKENSYLAEEVLYFNKAAKRQKHMLLAVDIMKEFIEKSRTRFDGKRINNTYYEYSICGKEVKLCCEDYNQSMLNEYLSKFGLKIPYLYGRYFTVDLLNNE